MEPTVILLTLLHVLVFVYWLGGDLGAFYASHILTDRTQPTPARAAAAKVLSAVDMAPRTALILAAPTGLHLAALKSWLTVSDLQIAVVWLASLAWLALAWIIHLRHAPPRAFARRLDLVLRWSAIAILLVGASGLLMEAPLFIRLKLVILALAIFAGLMVRVVLAPFGPAFVRLVSGDGDDAVNNTLETTLQRARPFVIGIWALLLLAATLGIATPQ